MFICISLCIFQTKFWTSGPVCVSSLTIKETSLLYSDGRVDLFSADFCQKQAERGVWPLTFVHQAVGSYQMFRSCFLVTVVWAGLAGTQWASGTGSPSSLSWERQRAAALMSRYVTFGWWASSGWETADVCLGLRPLTLLVTEALNLLSTFKYWELESDLQFSWKSSFLTWNSGSEKLRQLKVSLTGSFDRLSWKCRCSDFYDFSSKLSLKVWCLIDCRRV